ncbi:MAG: alpha/beta hydrolase [Spirochaetales bacterium]|nr:alpha/beta hydrolase [Spirochaetales bacterium]
MKRLSFIIAALLLLFSCSAYYTEGDYFFIQSGGADMPVWVKGNTSSTTAIIYLHGGPGDGCIHFSLVPQFFIEDDYMVVYWDQRHAGQSQGNPDINASKMDNFVADTDLVIEAVKLRHPNLTRIFLLGNSWGTAVGAAYLVHGDDYAGRQAKIAGFISTFGTCDYTLSYRHAAPRITAYADVQIASGIDTAYWDECKSFYMNTPSLKDAADLREHTGYVIRSGGYSVDESAAPSPDIHILAFALASPVALFPLLLTNGANDTSEDFIGWLVTDDSLDAELARLTVPLLVVSGRKDLMAGWQAGLSLYLGTGDIDTSVSSYETGTEWTDGDRTFMILEDTAHGSFGSSEDITAYQAGIQNFIAGYE